MKEQQYTNKYSERGLIEKIRINTKKIGKSILSKALILFYAAKDPDTPVWAKSIIYGVLGYFIFPIDAIPDITPFIGFSDDLTAMITAISVIAANIKQSHVDKANLMMEKILN